MDEFQAEDSLPVDGNAGNSAERESLGNGQIDGAAEPAPSRGSYWDKHVNPPPARQVGEARPTPAGPPAPARAPRPATPRPGMMPAPLTSTGAPVAVPSRPVAVAPRHLHRSKILIAVLALVLVAGGVVGGILVTSHHSSVPGAGVAPAAFVVSSTQTTMSQHTADIAINGTVNGPAGVVPITGTGQADFDTNAFSATVTFAEGQHSFVDRELVENGHFYVGLTIDGTDMSAVTGGPHWIDVPLPDESSSALLTGNIDPLDQLKLMEQRGATVLPLGTTTIDGTLVSGYAVTPSEAQVQQKVEREIQSLHLSPAVAQQLLAVTQELGTPTARLYFDGSGLLRRESTSFGGGSNSASGASSASGTVSMSFTHFGAPVSLPVPASNDVIGFDQFEQDAQAYDSAQQA